MGIGCYVLMTFDYNQVGPNYQWVYLICHKNKLFLLPVWATCTATSPFSSTLKKKKFNPLYFKIKNKKFNPPISRGRNPLSIGARQLLMQLQTRQLQCYFNQYFPIILHVHDVVWPTCFSPICHHFNVSFSFFNYYY